MQTPTNRVYRLQSLCRRQSPFRILMIIGSLTLLSTAGCKSVGEANSYGAAVELSDQTEKQFGNGGRYIIAAPKSNDPSKAYGLLILLHGSSASSYDRFVDDMRSISEQKDLVPVSVLAPNGQGWNEGDQVAAADYLDDLIQNTLFKDYNIDKNRIFFSGQSSGAGFLASHYVPLKAHQYTGGAFFQCGISPPEAQVQGTEADHQRFATHIMINSDDFWMDKFTPTIGAYKQLGFPTTNTDAGPGGHCNFDQAQTIADNIDKMSAAITIDPAANATNSQPDTSSQADPSEKVLGEFL